MATRKRRQHDRKMAKLKHNKRLCFYVSEDLKIHLSLMSRRMGHDGLSPYIRQLLHRGLIEDRKSVPTAFLRTRPGATIFKLDDGVFLPIAQAQGGERVWVIGVHGYLPSALGGKIGYIADITRGTVEGGLEGRDVYLSSEDVIDL